MTRHSDIVYPHAGNYKRANDTDSPIYKPIHTSKFNFVDDGSYFSDSVTMNCLDKSAGISPFLNSDSHLLISDVNSVAWAASDDTCNPHGDYTFREFLFVSGNKGVTIHAFSQNVELEPSISEPSSDVKSEQGTMVERETSVSVAKETTFNTYPETETIKSDKIVKQYCSDDESRCVSHNSTLKKGLHSFFSQVETQRIDNNMWTKFPDDSSYPRSAKSVSFTIFERNLLPDPSFNASDSQDVSPKFTDAPCPSGSKTDILSYLIEEWMSTSYRCTRVVSGHGLNLIGFLLSLEEHSVVSASNASVRNLGNNLLLVARLDRCGMQWLCCVQLEEISDSDMMVEWVDFQLSDDFIACLRTSGSIFFYGTSTGKYVTQIDILSSCGFSKLSHNQDLNGSVHLDSYESSNIEGKSSRGVSKIIFKKLIFSLHSSLLSAIDESGIVYVMRLRDLLPHSTNLPGNKLSHLGTLNFGLLTGWEVGGTDISSQNVLPDLLYSPTKNTSHLRSTSTDYNVNENQYDFGLSCFPTPARQLVSRHIRKVFLPAEKFGQYDHISISSFGVTRLVKCRKAEGKNRLKILHTSFHLNAAVDDMEIQNSEFKLSKGSEGTNIDDAIGFVAQGYVYLLARDGLLVALPNLSFSSTFLPVEKINYGRLSVDVDIQSQNMKLVAGETPERWSQWKVEILDKVIIYECPKEADRLCLRNGERFY